MWPKALSQLIELAPHITRLLPLADRALKDKEKDKSATEESSRKALDAMAEGLRGDLGQVTAAHAGLYRELHDQSEKLSSLNTELRASNLAAEAAEARLTRIEARLARFNTLLILAAMLLLALFGGTLAIFLRLR